MNFRNVSHLLKTDWQRLCVPIVVLWVLLLISAMPWLLHDPTSFNIPVWDIGGNIDEPRGLPSGSSIRDFVGVAADVAIVMPLLLATVLGMHDQRWQAVSPIRSSQRIVAKTLALFLFVVLPHLLLGVAVAALNGFSQSFIVSFVAETGLLLMLIYGTMALFGRCCGSFWSWTGATACLAGLTYLIGGVMSRADGPRNLLGVFAGIWSLDDRPLDWMQALLSLLLVVALPVIFRRRSGSVTGMAAAVLGLLAASYFSAWLSVRPALWERSITMDPVRPVVSPDGVRWGDEGWAYQAASPPGLQGSIDTTGLSPGTFVKWQSSAMPAARRPVPYGGSSDELTALKQILPAPLVIDPGSKDFFSFARDPKNHPPASVHVTGFVFRYRKIAELPLGENRVVATRDDVIIAARLRTNKAKGPLAEVSLKFPMDLKGLSYFLYLPKSEKCVGVEQVYGGYGVSPGGVAWRQMVMAAPARLLSGTEEWGHARLLVLQPEFLGVISRDLALPSVIDAPVPSSYDWMPEPKYDYRNNEYYSKLRPNRPDPATCTEKEASLYLRSLMALTQSEPIVRDLAEYAPRFPRLFALYSQRDHIVEAIKNNVPDASKAEVLSTIGSPMQTYRLVRCLNARDWMDPVRDPLLAGLKIPSLTARNDISPVATAVARLEDPMTYPALLSAYETTGDSEIYEVIRSLSGITPELDKVVERVSQRLSPFYDLGGRPSVYLSDALREFSGPVSHGNAVAFSKLIQFARRPGLEGYVMDAGIVRITPISGDSTVPGINQPKEGELHTPHEWRAYFEGKTPADFTYDPLARCWRPVSKTP
jgi:hypothetical protein